MCGWEYLVYDCGCEVKAFCSSEDPCDAVRDDPFDGKCSEEWSIGGIHVHEICTDCFTKDEARRIFLAFHARVDAEAVVAAPPAEQQQQHESFEQERAMSDGEDAPRSVDSGLGEDLNDQGTGLEDDGNDADDDQSSESDSS